MHHMINFVFSIGKQPYREAINFVSYIHACTIYSYMYNNINYTYLYAYKLSSSFNKYNRHSVK